MSQLLTIMLLVMHSQSSLFGPHEFLPTLTFVITRRADERQKELHGTPDLDADIVEGRSQL